MNKRFVRYVGQHHWGMLATFIAISGTAYAASELPPNSVGTRQLQRHAVTLSKISPGTQDRLRGRTGRTGRVGPAGPTGPSDGYYSASGLLITGFAPPQGASVTVPPGNYIATGGCTASQGASTGQSVSTLTFGTADAILVATASGQQPPSSLYPPDNLARSHRRRRCLTPATSV